jgi:hypothetical protein
MKDKLLVLIDCLTEDKIELAYEYLKQLIKGKKVICEARNSCIRKACTHNIPHYQNKQCQNPCYELTQGNAVCSHVNNQER